jgi:hypothetical protein
VHIGLTTHVGVVLLPICSAVAVFGVVFATEDTGIAVPLHVAVLN